MKTKYIKVPVSERLPEKEGKYLARVLGYSNFEFYRFLVMDFDTAFEIVEWLEEVPDREEEMRERLNSLIHHIELFTKGNIGEQEYFENEIKAAKKLLKQTT